MRARQVLWIAAVAVLPPLAAAAQIALDGTLPNGRTDVLAGPDYQITEPMGARVGSNLFHSFHQFNVFTGESATFSALTPPDRVIARVTGFDPVSLTSAPQPSTLNGPVVFDASMGGASLYFVNPYGVVLGSESSLDVRGTAIFSTADFVRFDDMARTTLSSRNEGPPTLVSAPPSHFGFLGGGAAADVEFSGSPGFGSAPLGFGGERLGAVGGDVEITRTLSVAGGRIDLAAVGADAVEVDANLVDYAPAADQTLGEVRVQRSGVDFGSLDTRSINPAGPQGAIVIRGGRFVLDGFGVTALAGGDLGAGGAAVDVAVTGDAQVANGAALGVVASGAAPAGGVRVDAGGEVRVAGGAFVGVSIGGSGGSPGIDVDADAIIVTEAGQIISDSGPGSAGDVSLHARGTGGIAITDGGSVVSNANAGAAGGAIGLEAPHGEITLAEGGAVSSSSSPTAPGGDVGLAGRRISLSGQTTRVDVSHAVTTDPGAAVVPGATLTLRATESTDVFGGASVLSASTGRQEGGSISIEGGALTVVDEGRIETSTQGEGAGGEIVVTNDSVEIGRDSELFRPGFLGSAVDPGANGVGGDVTLDTGTVLLRDGGQISTTTQGNAAAPGNGDGGDLTIRASESFTATGEFDDPVLGLRTSGLFARSGILGEPPTQADGGDIAVTAPEITLSDGALVSAASVGPGDAGNVTLDATGTLAILGAGTQNTAVSARALAGGQAGNVTLDGAVVELRDGGTAAVTSALDGDAGSVIVTGGDLVVSGAAPTGESALSAETDGDGSAGGIDVDVTGDLLVEDGARITVRSRAGGPAGDVTLDASRITVRTEGTVSAEAASAAGGNVELTAAKVRLDEGGQLTVRADGARDAGTVRVNAGRFEAFDSEVSAEAQAFGGNIEILAADRVHLVRSELTALSQGGANAMGLAGGNVTIGPQAAGPRPAVVPNASRISADGRGNADGGNVTLSGRPLLVSADSTVTASSELGTQGTVLLQGLEGAIAGEVVALPTEFLDPSALLEEPCLAREDVSGTFTVRRIGALPPPPDADAAPETDAGAAQCGEP